MDARPLVSIIVNNYNYARYLREAIESALNQTYAATEVIVVDDGSTDASRAIISGYGERILPVLKSNGGQASAFNAGFSHSRGEVVVFLDADDLLATDLAERVAQAYCSEPESAKIHFRLQVVDASGQPTGWTQPPADKPLPQGDLRAQLLSFPDDIAWQPTSGNAFPAWVLHRIMPIPVEVFPYTGADLYLMNLSALFGKVTAIQEVGGFYRAHGANLHHTAAWSPELSHKIIRRALEIHRLLGEWGSTLGLAGFGARPEEVLSVTFLAHRMASLRADPENHPLPKDTPLSLYRKALRASARRFDLPWSARSLYFFWFSAALLSPRRSIPRLAEMFFIPETRGRLHPLLALARRVNFRR